MLRKLYYLLQPKLRFLVRYLLFLPVDIAHSFRKKEDELVPPKRLIYIGSGNFIEIGNLFLQDFIKKQIINPDSHVLDVGCGIGRSAVPMTRYLQDGTYDGFDIVALGINWCVRNITTKHPNFNFKLVSLYNDLYTDDGLSAKTFVFPYDSNCFDLVIVLSVFTHMVEEEVEQYMSEISRVLKRGGYCYATFFILNEASQESMTRKNNKFNFRFRKGNYSLISDKVTSANVAYDENYLLNDLFPRNNLTLKSLEYGAWSTNSKGSLINFQDIAVLQKENTD